jgi:hypothetical protein
MSYAKIDPLGDKLDGGSSIGASASLSLQGAADLAAKAKGGVKASEILALAAAGSAAIPVVGAVGSAVLGTGAAIAALIDNYGKDLENLIGDIAGDIDEFFKCGFDGSCYAALDKQRKKDKALAEVFKKSAKEIRDTSKKAKSGDIKAGARLEIATGIAYNNYLKWLSRRSALEAQLKAVQKMPLGTGKKLEEEVKKQIEAAKIVEKDIKSGKKKITFSDQTSAKMLLEGWTIARKDWAKYEKEYDKQLKAKASKVVTKVKTEVKKAADKTPQKAAKPALKAVKGSFVPLNRVRGPVVGAFAKTNGLSKEGQEGFLVEKDGKITGGKFI